MQKMLNDIRILTATLRQMGLDADEARPEYTKATSLCDSPKLEDDVMEFATEMDHRMNEDKRPIGSWTDDLCDELSNKYQLSGYGVNSGIRYLITNSKRGAELRNWKAGENARILAKYGMQR